MTDEQHVSAAINAAGWVYFFTERARGDSTVTLSPREFSHFREFVLSLGFSCEVYHTIDQGEWYGWRVLVSGRSA